MTITDLPSVLQETGLPVTLMSWPEDKAPALPFICYTLPSTNNLFADGISYVEVYVVDVELYTDLRDLAIEKLLEDVFAAHGIPWNKDVYFVESENCYQILYEIEV